MIKSQRKLNVKRFAILILFIIVLLVAVPACVKKTGSIINEKNDKFIASSDIEVKLYNENFQELGTVARGMKVTSYNRVIKGNDKRIFRKIKFNKKIYLIDERNLVDKQKDIVLEKEMYVRTPATIYKSEKDSIILSMVKKGEKLEIIDFDKIDNKGYVHKYKIKYNDVVGYVYGKYLVNNKEISLKHYDEEKTYLIHKNRGNTLGGGSAANLDFYPNVKPQFSQNVMPKEVRSLYLNTGVINKIDEYIKLAKESNINAFVVDIKDNMSPGYDSQVMKKYSPTNYKYANNSFDSYKVGIKKLKDAGFYVIGRITVFKDSYFVKDHPESAISDNKTGQPFLHNNSYWPSAYDRKVWEFNVELAKEAVLEMGFNEIQFDYVRFPDRVYKLELDGLINMKNKYNEEKAQAIQGFLMYATDEIHQLNAYVSADVFGESAHNYVTGYGQYWGAISNVVDVISGMPYPDHFNAYEYGFKEVVWTVPYKLLNFWGMNYVVKRQQEIPTPAIVRTWIQTYDTGKRPAVEYNSDRIYDQIKGLYNAGLTGGFMTWNSSSSLAKYKSVSPAFLKISREE